MSPVWDDEFVFDDINIASVPPPSTVDIARAMSDGRRLRRNRALGVTGGVAAGLAAVCAAGLVVSGGGSAKTQAADSGLRITNTNPFVVGARYGWLPAGVEQDGSSLLFGAFRLTADSASSTPDTALSLRTFPSGTSEQSALVAIAADEGPSNSVTVDTESPIDGKPAYSVTNSTPIASTVQVVTLLWQMSNGRWAELYESVSNSSAVATEVMAQARHVAEAVTPDTTGAALPFSIKGLPADAQINSYSSGLQDTSTTVWTAQIGIVTGGITLVYDVGPDGDVLPMTLGPTKCTDRNGLEACVTWSNGHLSGSFPASRLQALADDVSLRSPDQATWTTDVFPDH
jgi:hypothetical protein